ncbi:MAG: hypothetical protein QXZ08_01420 [Nitrososphaeria archaeon]
MQNNNTKTFLEFIYDAELKKLLAYITATITTLYFHFNLLIQVSNKTIFPPIFSSIFSFALWIAGCYFFIMATTKYIEIKQLECKLGITNIYEELSKNWNIFSKLLHFFHYQMTGIKYEQWKKHSLFIDIITIIFIALTGYMFLIVQLEIYNP